LEPDDAGSKAEEQASQPVGGNKISQGSSRLMMMATLN